MSEVKVNKISPRTACGTVTLGDSGDTIALGCGATQTGFGRTGTVDWITTPKVTGDSPVTGVSGNGYFLNTTSGLITFNLPAGSAGDIISIADYAATWQTYEVTVTPNGTDKIGGFNLNANANVKGQSITFVYVDSTQGWINTMDSTSNVRGITYMSASGGTPCSGAVSGNCKVHTFTGPGTFTVNCVSSCSTYNIISYAMVAGGGGSGVRCAGGAGGAGGFRETKGPATPYTASPLCGVDTPSNLITVTATGYPIVVGGGGAAAPGTSANGSKGAPTTFAGLTATGGGYGIGAGPPWPVAGCGGSGGGGAGSDCSDGSTGNTPAVTPAQGTDGGDGASGGGSYQESGGGGGGATVAGSDGVGNAAGGAGGTGATTSISATPTAYAGGGGGGSGGASGPAVGAGGAGGGGDGGNCQQCTAAQDGGCNTGGGAGGAGGNGAGKAKAGGSGIVIIRYKFQ